MKFKIVTIYNVRKDPIGKAFIYLSNLASFSRLDSLNYLFLFGTLRFFITYVGLICDLIKAIFTNIIHEVC